ncbi:hypothetical protein [Ramlibacter sp.]|uniref:hypothetical protein n=1 Tax=Ramlibacter sp. TaxID=1917967 RepID=UPI002D39D5E6|nr:hypothetical protein [Ramlibacter sp.]HYD75650.1 hypothetical protein [Ramlibacter sp.]
MFIELSPHLPASSRTSTNFPLAAIEELTLTVERSGRDSRGSAPPWFKSGVRRDALGWPIHAAVEGSAGQGMTLTIQAENRP